MKFWQTSPILFPLINASITLKQHKEIIINRMCIFIEEEEFKLSSEESGKILKYNFVLMIQISFFKLKLTLGLTNFVLLIQISFSYFKW